MSNQIKKTLKLIPEVVWFQEGPGVRTNQYTNEGVKLINVANLVNGNLDLSTSKRYISKEEAYGPYKHFLVDDGDFIIASSGIKVDYFEKKMGFATNKHLPLCMNTSTIRFKVLNKNELNIRYFMYYLKSDAFKEQLLKNITGSAQLNFGPSHLKKMHITLVDMSMQEEIVNKLDSIEKLISARKSELDKLDLLIKAKFNEMFGNPITNDKDKSIKLSSFANLKAGKNITSKNIYDYSVLNQYPCYGGNGIRGYVDKFSHSGKFCLIGRQGALCGNVQFATNKFYVTEHAIVVTQKQFNDLWLYYCLTFLNLNRLQTGAAQPGLNIEILGNVDILNPPIELQNQFADFVNKVNELKDKVNASLTSLTLLKKQQMQKYFG